MSFRRNLVSIQHSAQLKQDASSPGLPKALGRAGMTFSFTFANIF
jgi:hypothetical protein